MNPFRSASAPYIATLLISALGWLLTTLHGEIRSAAVLAYEIRVQGDQLTLEMSNLSSSAAIKDAPVALICPDTKPCITPVNPGAASPRYGRPMRVAPVGDYPRVSTSDETQISAVVSLPAGGRTRLTTPYRDVPPDFYAFQNSGTPLQVVEAKSLKGLFIAHYGLFLGALLGLLSIALGVWLVRNLFPFKTEPQGETPPMRIVLSLDDSGCA
jgi:hypothetical protein